MEQERSAGRSIRDAEKTVLQELVPMWRARIQAALICVLVIGARYRRSTFQGARETRESSVEIVGSKRTQRGAKLRALTIESSRPLTTNFSTKPAACTYYEGSLSFEVHFFLLQAGKKKKKK